MPLIKRTDKTTQPTVSAARLDSPDADMRWRAARALGAEPDALPAIVTALRSETEPTVREALFTCLVTIHTVAAAQAAAEFVRSEDASVRSGALDALATMPGVIGAVLPDLLRDSDRDVRLLTCDLVRGLDAAAAVDLLAPLLRVDVDPSVCGAAVDVLAEIGDRDALAPLQACKARFPGEAFLSFAIDAAVERIGADRNE